MKLIAFSIFLAITVDNCSGRPQLRVVESLEDCHSVTASCWEVTNDDRLIFRPRD